MAEFVNPFTGKVPDRKLSLRELVRAIRLNVAAEEEAAHLYTALADAADDPVAKAVLEDIANEERVHIGEFQHLIQLLTGDEDKWLADGAGEVDTMAAKVGKPAPSQVKTPSTSSEEPTIGPMK